MTDTHPSETVLVPVPVEHLQVVYRLLADLMSRSPTSFIDDPNAVEVGGQGRWDPRMVERLRTSIHLPAAKSLIDVVADKAPEEISMQEVLEVVNIDSNRMRGALAGLTRLTTKLYGRRTWPFSVRYNPQGLAFYRMDNTVAAWWSR